MIRWAPLGMLKLEKIRRFFFPSRPLKTFIRTHSFFQNLHPVAIRIRPPPLAKLLVKKIEIQTNQQKLRLL